MERLMGVIHSDFLIYWTGKDIDKNIGPNLNNEKLSYINNQKTVDAYIERLRDILKYGLWMTEDDSPEILEINRQKFEKPKED